MHEDRSANMHTREDPFAPDLGDWETIRLLSKNNAARVLGGITVREVENRIREGDLEAVNIGKRRLIVRESLDAYVARLRAEEAERRAQLAGAR